MTGIPDMILHLAHLEETGGQKDSGRSLIGFVSIGRDHQLDLPVFGVFRLKESQDLP